MSRANRGTLHLEDAQIVSQSAYEADQFVLRLTAPACAAHAEPGTFVHLTCDPTVPMRRPLSIMRADPKAGWIDLLYKIVGPGLRALAKRGPGETVSVIGPIGQPFRPHPQRPRTVLIGGGVGIPPMIFLAERLHALSESAYRPLVLMGSEIPFPFRARPSTLLLEGMPAGTIAAMPLLEQWGVPSRLASRAGLPGCFDGYVTELAGQWLETHSHAELAEVELFACGPTPMLAAAAQLARRYNVPCQVSLEEFMACGIGGCAGCTVRVRTREGDTMKRVCVDGPVFDALSVF